jgi:hypothetical protein
MRKIYLVVGMSICAYDAENREASRLSPYPDSSSNEPLHDFYEHLLAQGRKPTMARHFCSVPYPPGRASVRPKIDAASHKLVSTCHIFLLTFDI